MGMYHADFYKDSTTGAVTYSWKEAMYWKTLGHRVMHYYKDGGCLMI